MSAQGTPVAGLVELLQRMEVIPQDKQSMRIWMAYMERYVHPSHFLSFIRYLQDTSNEAHISHALILFFSLFSILFLMDAGDSTHNSSDME